MLEVIAIVFVCLWMLGKWFKSCILWHTDKYSMSFLTKKDVDRAMNDWFDSAGSFLKTSAWGCFATVVGSAGAVMALIALYVIFQMIHGMS